MKVKAAEDEIVEIWQASDAHDEAGQGGQDPAALFEHVLTAAREPRV